MSSGLSSADATTLYERQRDISPMRISATQLDIALEKAATLSRRALDSDAAHVTLPFRVVEKLSIRSGGQTFTVEGHATSLLGAALPEKIDEIVFMYFVETEIGGKQFSVQNVSIRFGSFVRTVKVSGADRHQVDAISLSIAEHFEAISSTVGGYFFEGLMEMALLFSVIVLALIFVGAVKSGSISQRKFLVGFAVFTTTVVIFYFLLNAGAFSGFLVYQANPDLLVRFGPEIGFIGLILSVLSLFSGLLPKGKESTISLGPQPPPQSSSKL